MSKTLDAVIERVSRLPPERQEEIAQVLERLVDLDVDAASRLTVEDWREIDRRVGAPPRYASDGEVEAFFRDAEG